jgi:hypothetical protein
VPLDRQRLAQLQWALPLSPPVQISPPDQEPIKDQGASDHETPTHLGLSTYRVTPEQEAFVESTSTDILLLV